MILAKHFESHNYVETVLYPGLETHPNHKIAKAKQTDSMRGMLSIIIAGSEADAINVVRNCKVFYPQLL